MIFLYIILLITTLLMWKLHLKLLQNSVKNLKLVKKKGRFFWKDMISCDSRLYKKMMGRMSWDIAGPKVWLYLKIWLSYQKCHVNFSERSTLIYALGNMSGYQDLIIFPTCSPFLTTSTNQRVYFIVIFYKDYVENGKLRWLEWTEFFSFFIIN